ncbi:hypothetical protein [Archangium primigenium]|uniref:hypothetical protein n=1 Tax=[Archangium] primigenium TaxID=2792470 RepID=UPI001957EAD0|nr:hypothetical protein [Archangium primigenium]MBM7112502.1 hypothetical protein [Archangium primigenium]
MRRPLLLSVSILCSLASGCGGEATSPGGDFEVPSNRTGPQGPQGERGPPGPAGQYARIRTVSPGGSARDSGEALRKTLEGILEPSADSPWLIYLEPGVYDLGEQGLHPRPYIYFQGAGAGLTTVRSTSAEPTFTAVAHSELSALTVENRGGGPRAVALATPSSDFRAHELEALAQGGLERTAAIVATGASGEVITQGAEFTRVRARAQADAGSVAGLECQDCTLRLTGSTFRGEGGRQAVGVSAIGGSLELWDTTADGFKGAEESLGVEARSSAHLMLVRAEARGREAPASTGVRLSSSTASVRDSTLAGTGQPGHQTRALDTSRVGRLTYKVEVERSTLVGASQVVRGAEGYSIFIGGSQLRGGQVEGGGMVACHGSYDENFTSPAPACP